MAATPVAGLDVKGLATAATSHAIWGLFPLFFIQLAGVAPIEIVAHRVFWAFPATAAVVVALGRWHQVRTVFQTPRTLLVFVGSSLCVTINWVTFVYAVGHGQTLQSSLGYFLFPLVTVGLAVVVLHETMTRRQIWALAVVALGVLVLTVIGGQPPWIALILATTFSFYGLLRKTAPTEALVGMTVETLLISPFAMTAMVYYGLSGTSGFLDQGLETAVLLIIAGPMTAFPLVLFAIAARRLKLATVGLLQFILPTLQFLIAVFVFDEPFGAGQLVSFALIWAGLLIYADFKAIIDWRRVR